MVLAAIALMALTLWNSLQIGRLMLRPAIVPVATVHAPLNIKPPQSTATMVTNIAQARLFGEAAPSLRMAKTIPASHVPFKLLGIYAQDDGRGYAIIAASSGKAKVYTVGAQLPGQIKLLRIEAKRVLINTPRGEEAIDLRKAANQAISLSDAHSTTKTPTARMMQQSLEVH